MCNLCLCVFFLCMWLHLSNDVCTRACRGNLRGCSSPADSCLTAVAEGLGEAVKTSQIDLVSAAATARQTLRSTQA